MAMLKKHGVSCSKGEYHDIINGKKTLALRSMVWKYRSPMKVGDKLTIHEWERFSKVPGAYKYTGRYMKIVVTDIIGKNYPDSGVVHVRFKII